MIDAPVVVMSKKILGWSKLMHAMVYLDEEQHRMLKLDQYDAIGRLLALLPEPLQYEFQLDRAARWELPVEAIEYLDRQNHLLERSEHL